MFQRAKKLIYQRRWRIFAAFSSRCRDMFDMEKWIGKYRIRYWYHVLLLTRYTIPRATKFWLQ